MEQPVIYKKNKSSDERITIHLQCISMTHYNPVNIWKHDQDESGDKARYINNCKLHINNNTNTTIESNTLPERSDSDDEVAIIIVCEHITVSGTKIQQLPILLLNRHRDRSEFN